MEAKVANLTEEKINKMPYPKFKRYLAYHTNPKDFLNPKPTMEDDLAHLERIKEGNKNLGKML